MATFQDVSGAVVGRRGHRDARRHRELCKDAIRKGLREIIGEISFITMDPGGKTFTVSIEELKQYSFAYGRRVKLCGTGGPSGPAGKRGQKFIIPKDERPGRGPGGGPDTPVGSGIVTVQLDYRELLQHLFEDLELPDFARKRMRVIVVQERTGMVGVTRKGPLVRLARRQSIRQRARRVFGQRREGRTPHEGFVEEDLRFRRPSTRERFASNAAVILMMDISGSMDFFKRYLCRAFFWILFNFVRLKYENTELVFIVHHSTAREVEEHEFFRTTESGGTLCSGAYRVALDLIGKGKRFDPETCNIYAFHMSDGDNWEDDEGRAVELAEQLCKVCNLFGFGQVLGHWDDVALGWFQGLSAEKHWSNLYDEFAKIQPLHDNLALVRITKREDVWPQFEAMMKKEKVKKGGSHVLS